MAKRKNHFDWNKYFKKMAIWLSYRFIEMGILFAGGSLFIKVHSL